ncbi:MAG: hypothetical protein JOS17DRAFT_542040 [Linnemannia elongata]|nr:MAG: hypothetical protein JOS17DRAFT_542040 [Linnemannia elongata]
MNELSFSFCISTFCSFLYTCLLFIFHFTLFFTPTFIFKISPFLSLPSPTSPFLLLHHSFTTSPSLLFSNTFCCCSSIERRFPWSSTNIKNPLATRSLVYFHSLPSFPFFSVSAFLPTSTPSFHCLAVLLFSFSLSLSLTFRFSLSLVFLSFHPTLLPFSSRTLTISPCPLPTTFCLRINTSSHPFLQDSFTSSSIFYLHTHPLLLNLLFAPFVFYLLCSDSFDHQKLGRTATRSRLCSFFFFSYSVFFFIPLCLLLFPFSPGPSSLSSFFRCMSSNT